MKDYKQYRLEDYTFIYENYVNEEFVNLGYDDEDIKKMSSELLAYRHNNPPKLKGSLIKGSGGAVKVRVSKRSSTRGSEDRLIYTLDQRKLIYFIQIYSKSKKKDISKRELKEISKLVNHFRELPIKGLVGATRNPIPGGLIKAIGGAIGVAGGVAKSIKHLENFEIVDEEIIIE